jgi:predicted HAD superfamily Cof-like phosphohydrolase
MNLGVTSIYLQGIDNAEIIATVHGRVEKLAPTGGRRSHQVTPKVRGGGERKPAASPRTQPQRLPVRRLSS